MKSKFLALFIISILFITSSFAQEKKWKFFSDFQLAPNMKIFTGHNFLSDGHKPTYLGFHTEIDFIEYKNFVFGGIYEFNTSEVEKPDMVGHFNDINLHHIAAGVGYKFLSKEKKYTIIPKLIFGEIQSKQKAPGYYAMNKGKYWGITGQFDYNFSKNIAVFTTIGYNFYTFNVQTTPEYLNYFNKSNALNFSLGIKF